MTAALIVYELKGSDAKVKTDLPFAKGKRVLVVRLRRSGSKVPIDFALIGWRSPTNPSAGDIVAVKAHPVHQLTGMQVWEVRETWRRRDHPRMSVAGAVELLRSMGIAAEPFNASSHGFTEA
jgi:hypothetical protein